MEINNTKFFNNSLTIVSDEEYNSINNIVFIFIGNISIYDSEFS